MFPIIDVSYFVFTPGMSVSVATMNYQDYAALQNSLNSYLQSSADNEEVTLPSNLTMENINAAIQSEGSHNFI